MATMNQAQRKPSGWSFLWQGVAIRRRHFVVLFLLSLVSNLLMLVGPIFMLQIYDRVLGSRSVPTLLALTALVVVLFMYSALIETLRTRIAVRMSMQVHHDLAPRAFRSAIGGRTRDTGDPIRDLDTVRSFVAGPGPASLLDLPWLPAYMILVFALHPLLGVVAIAGALVMVTLLIVNEAMATTPNRLASASLVERQNLLEDARANSDAIVAMGMLPALTSRFLSSADAVTESQRRSSDQAAFFGSYSRAFRLLLQSGVLAAGAYLVIIGQLSAGLMLAASVITARALAPVEQLVGHWKGFVAARQALQRLSERITQLPSDAPRTHLPSPTGSMAVTGLASGPNNETPLIVDVSFSVTAGEGLGIIGPSGSGKSTVGRAITGIWPSLRGEIRFDGALLSHYDPAALGAAIGYLPQEVDLFDGTIAENICRFRKPDSSAPILAAARASGTHQLISRLPNGYDTRIGPRGTTLSAGQRQRVGLARAIYGDPFLLVLDEPNANLDQEGEQALVEALGAAKARGAAVIIIAHRPSAIIATEKLLVMTGGRQIAYGERDEVLRRVTRPAPIAVADARSSHG
jgi:ATP-binding cassette subfamily C protein PrsD